MLRTRYIGFKWVVRFVCDLCLQERCLNILASTHLVGVKDGDTHWVLVSLPCICFVYGIISERQPILPPLDTLRRMQHPTSLIHKIT